MKFIEAIEAMEAAQKVKLGSGSAWFYVGTAGDLQENHTKYSASIVRIINNQINATQERIDQLLTNPPDLGRWARREIKTLHPSVTWESYLDYVKYWMRQVEQKTARLNDLKRSLVEFRPLEKRTVREIRDASPLVDAGVKNILVEGEERGRFWDSSEGSGFAMSVDDEDEIEAGV